MDEYVVDFDSKVEDEINAIIICQNRTEEAPNDENVMNPHAYAIAVNILQDHIERIVYEIS